MKHTLALAAVVAVAASAAAACGPAPKKHRISDILLSYQFYANVSDVRISETYLPGDIVEVRLIAADASAQDAILFSDGGGDGAGSGCPTIFHLTINGGETVDQYNQVLITLDTSIVHDANRIGTEIDAVELDGSDSTGPFTQFATGADASSFASDGTGNDYSGLQATGMPDVTGCADDPHAWAAAP